MEQSMNAGRKDIGLLILRVVPSAMMMVHGWGKLTAIIAGDMGFPDPLGAGPALSKILACGAEFFCAAAVALGLWTRCSAIPVAFTMFVAVFIIHGNDPFEDKEFALLYLVVFSALALLGGGKWTLDRFSRRR
jgi:putative oxidoreductase